MSLPSNELGSTGLILPRMGLGLAALGRPGYINLGHGDDLAHDYVVEAMEGRTHRMLDLAYQKGVRYFDVARSYGRAEQFIQSWVKEKEVKDVVIGSKWGYIYTAEWKIEAEHHEIKRHTLEVLEKQWEESAVLRPHLKLYHIHSATTDSGVLLNKEVLNRLAKIKEEGIKVGLSLSGSQQGEVLEDALLVRVDGQYLFDTVQATFNILEQSVSDILRQASASGIGIIIKEALANGRLTPRNRKKDFEPTKVVLEAIMEEYGIKMDMLSLAYVLHQPWAQMVLSGAAVEEHLKSNLAATKVELRADTLEQLKELAIDPLAYWGERKRMPWN